MKRIFIILLIAILFISSILIGSPIKYNAIIVNVLAIATSVIYIAINKFKYKKRIIQNKLDIGIIFLCLVPFIPIIANTYINLNDSINYVLKYITGLAVYFLAKLLCKEETKYEKYIINTILISSVMLCIFGIDNMTTKFFTPWLEKLNCVYVINTDNRMFSSLGYANTFAVITAMSLFLAMGRIQQSDNKKEKSILSSFIFLYIATIILAYSKATMLVIVIVYLLYLIGIRKKKNIIENIYLLVAQGCLAIIYVNMWNKLILAKEYVAIWIVTVLFLVIAILIENVLEKLYAKIEKITIKTYIISLISLFIIAVLAIGVGMNLTKPLTIFQNKNAERTVKYKILNIQPNTQYCFEFDIESFSEFENRKNYIIRIEEENKYYDTVETHEISFNTCNEKMKIEFTSTDETIEIGLYFESTYSAAQKGVTIKSLYINGKEEPLNYAYLPVSLVNKIRSITITNKGVWERGAFYKDAFKIIKDNWLFGAGGNAWNNLYTSVQSYSYSATEVHSYIIQVFLEYGILGLLAFIFILVQIIKIALKKMKEKEENSISILCAMAILLAHSIIDFDMSFLYVMILFFVLLGIMSTKEEKEKVKVKILEYIIGIIMIGVLGVAILEWLVPSKLSYKTIYLKNKIIYGESTVKNSEILEALNQIEVYEKNIYFNIDYLSYLDYNNIEIEDLENVYNKIKNTKLLVNVKYNKIKNELIQKIIESIDNPEYLKKFAQIIVDENEEVLERIEDRDKNRLEKEEVEIYIENQNRIYQLALKYIN